MSYDSYGFCPDCNQEISTQRHTCPGLSKKVEAPPRQSQMLNKQDKQLTALRAENERLRDAFYFAWSLRPMLGKTWDGESDPLALVMAAMDAALTEKGGE